MTEAQLIGELMARYNENRVKWIAQRGNAEGFDEWFTKQVTG